MSIQWCGFNLILKCITIDNVWLKYSFDQVGEYEKKMVPFNLGWIPIAYKVVFKKKLN